MKRKLFLPLIFILTLCFSVPCFASSHGGGGSSRGNIYSSDSLNARTIQAYNSLSYDEQASLIIDVFPLFASTLGFDYKSRITGVDNVDMYSRVDGYFQTRLNKIKNSYPNAEDYFNNSDDSSKLKRVFVDYSGGEYSYRENFVDYLVTIFSVPEDSDQFVISDTGGTNQLLINLVNDNVEDSGFINVDIPSYKNLNTNTIGGLDYYNNYLRICQMLRDNGYKYVMLSIRQYNGGNYRYIYACNDNLYFNSATSRLRFCDDNGNVPSIKWVFLSNEIGYCPDVSTWSTFQVSNDYMVGDPDSIYSWIRQESYITSYGASVFNLQANDWTTFQLATSLQGWNNNHGHYESPFELASYFGNVPTSTISSSNMTSYYINNYTDHSVRDSYNNVSGDNYGNPDFSSESTWKKQPEESNFNWIERILSAIGSFISSVLKGIGDSLANIVTSVLSVLQDMFGLLTEENIVILFMRGLMSWLPTPIPEVLISMCILSCFVGIFKIVKGLVS